MKALSKPFDLAKWEHVIDVEIESIHGSLWKIAEALWEIHHADAYGKSFETHCEERWRIGRERGWQYLKAWEAQERCGGIFDTVDQAYAMRKVSTKDAKYGIHDAKTARGARVYANKLLSNAGKRKRRKRIKKALDDAKKAPPEGFKGWVQVSKGKDGFDWMDSLPKQSVDLILTDPLWTPDRIKAGDPVKLGACAKRLLKPSGMLAVMVGGIGYYQWIEGIVNEVEENGETKILGVPYRWTISYIPFNPTLWNGKPVAKAKRVEHYNVAGLWKPVLIFGSHDHFIATDVVVVDTTQLLLLSKSLLKAQQTGSTVIDAKTLTDEEIKEVFEPEKDIHPFAQSVWGFRELVNLLSLPGQTVIDPFCGSGTTLGAGISAYNGKRVVKGNDLDPLMAEMAELNCKEAFWSEQQHWKEHKKPEGWQ